MVGSWHTYHAVVIRQTVEGEDKLISEDGGYIHHIVSGQQQLRCGTLDCLRAVRSVCPYWRQTFDNRN